MRGLPSALLTARAARSPSLKPQCGACVVAKRIVIAQTRVQQLARSQKNRNPGQSDRGFRTKGVIAGTTTTTKIPQTAMRGRSLVLVPIDRSAFVGLAFCLLSPNAKDPPPAPTPRAGPPVLGSPQTVSVIAGLAAMLAVIGLGLLHFTEPPEFIPG
jgi:hypothetical protein